MSKFKSLERYIGQVLSTPAEGLKKPLFDYERHMLPEAMDPLGAITRETENPASEYTRRIPRSLAAGVGARKGKLEKLADEGLMEAPWGRTNPWYDVEPLVAKLEAEFGTEEGREVANRFMKATAATSPMTNVSDNIAEATGAIEAAERGAKGISGLSGSDLSTATYHNKKGMLRSILRDDRDPPPDGSFHTVMAGTDKVPNFYRNLTGANTKMPEFIRDGEDAIRVNGPVTIDSIMMREMLGPEAGDKTPRDGMYRYLADIINKSVAPDAAGADTQAAVWTAAQREKHNNPAYDDTFLKALERRVAKTAGIRGEDPDKVLFDALLGRRSLLTTGGALAGAGAAAAASGGAFAHEDDLD
jgi:hypothetical protein